MATNGSVWASRWKPAFEVTSTLAMILLAAALAWEGRTKVSGSAAARAPGMTAKPPTQPLPIGQSAVMGSTAARLVVVEYSDFQCPACGKFAREIEPQVRHRYVDSGRVLFVFKHYPLPIHAFAPAAAEAAWCAAEQGRFWQMHDNLFGLKANLEEPNLESAASASGLDRGRFDLCRAGDTARRRVDAERDEATSIGVPATPAFYFGTLNRDKTVTVSEGIVGASSVEAFASVLDRLLR